MHSLGELDAGSSPKARSNPSLRPRVAAARPVRRRTSYSGLVRSPGSFSPVEKTRLSLCGQLSLVGSGDRLDLVDRGGDLAPEMSPPEAPAGAVVVVRINVASLGLGAGLELRDDPLATPSAHPATAP